MDSPRAFFQFPIGFSRELPSETMDMERYYLSIPYRILTVVEELWARMKDMQTFNSLSDSHEDHYVEIVKLAKIIFQFPIGFSHTKEDEAIINLLFQLSIPYRILTWFIVDDVTPVQFNFQFPIGFSLNCCISDI